MAAACNTTAIFVPPFVVGSIVGGAVAAVGALIAFRRRRK